MSSAENVNEKRDWKKRESFGSAMAQIAVVAVLLAGAVYFMYARGARREQVGKHLKEARAHALRGNPSDLQKALAELDLLFKVDDSAPDGLALAADIHTQLWLTHKVSGAEQKATDYLERAERADSKSEDRYGTRALHMIAEGKLQEADAFVEDLRKQGASSAKLWYAQALANVGMGNLAKAKPGFDHAKDKGWKDPRFATAYGEALFEEGSFLQALDMLSKATSANPDHLQARLDTALVRIHRRDRVKDASDAIQEILGREADLTPGLKARGLTAKAELASFEGKYDEAIKIADEALSLNPDEHFALFAKARALALKKDPKASDAFAAAIARRKVAPYFYFDGATLLQAAGSTDAALALLDQYEKTFKDVKAETADGKISVWLERDDKYWLTRGDVLKEAGKLDDALAAYEKAIAAKNVNLVRAHYAKATIFLARKEWDKAAEVLTDITPPDGSGALAEAYIAMGEALFAKKDFAPGCQNFAFALAKLKTQQAPREKLNGLLEDVNKRLIATGQKQLAKLWMEEARPLIQ